MKILMDVQTRSDNGETIGAGHLAPIIEGSESNVICCLPQAGYRPTTPAAEKTLPDQIDEQIMMPQSGSRPALPLSLIA
ncbi:unnamed protein product, partial [Mesorhabditis belari]|uniref:Uncharacterized protein n=1 Tax=Mesorhabditis belari TaxID=2138241 RepID=A0AAF3FC20_9BILA